MYGNNDKYITNKCLHFFLIWSFLFFFLIDVDFLFNFFSKGTNWFHFVCCFLNIVSNSCWVSGAEEPAEATATELASESENKGPGGEEVSDKEKYLLKRM